ncbi:helix-turn-helix domain-containing protein [Halobacillus litoralis]|uniref:Helix-turn-helix domain-containing protein n=1 Tax=Halobacillus litoralis TaxID=45668 RepID=A0A845EF85_9BACI|nr:helix-turn-helix domain-containing protein [Halobacillus litoralis]
MVKLYESGKPLKEIIKEYELTSSSFVRWIRQYKSSGFLKRMTIFHQRKKN